jgi:ABC-2 type transport system permease protein
MMALLHQGASIEVRPNWFLLPFAVIAAGAVAAALGMALGCRVQPRFGGLLFAVILGPMMLFGCAYYPWSRLADLGAVRYLFLLNPLTFVSEALRWAVTPDAGHMPVWLLGGGLLTYIVLLGWSGLRGFERRTIL